MGAYYESAEPYVPEPPDDPRPEATAIECYCGTLWYVEVEDHCPSCGREESEQMLSDEQLADE